MNKSIKNTAQAGFTLIELIVVIVILGILAATALPKFANLGGDARFASMNAAKGALASTSAMAHGKYLANTTATPLVTFSAEGTAVTFATAVASGYPKADANLATAAGLTSADYTVIVGPQAAVTDKSPAVGANEIVIVPNSINDTPSAVNCYVKYAEPTAINTPPAITVTGSGTACE